MHIPTHRIINHRIQSSELNSVKELVSHMGAIQAQDFNSAKWAIGSRLASPNKKEIEDAFNTGEIIRSHLMRPTWHFVTAEDYIWMLELTAPQIKTAVKHRFVDWGFNEAILYKSFDVMQKVLSGNTHKTREALMLDLQQAGINTDEGRAYHMMLWAELEGIVCSGSLQGKEHSYALLDERISVKQKLSKEEALATLALRFFTSHAPATLADFVWWSGLKTTDARKALLSVDKELQVEKIDGSDYWLPRHAVANKMVPSAFFLPAYDEYVIAYKDRSQVLNPAWGKTTISSNGVFKPIIVLNGEVIGIWKRSFKKDTVVVEQNLFRQVNTNEQELLEKAADKYAAYEGKILHLKK